MTRTGGPIAFAFMLLGNSILAVGPWLVRLSDVGPVATGAWRLTLALPFLWLVARISGQTPHIPRNGLLTIIFAAAIFYALDLAAWNAGIPLTKLGNATLFGNFGSVVFAVYGLVLLRRSPAPRQLIALLMAVSGGALLMKGSLELSPEHLTGDMLTLLGGVFYGGYLIFIERARAQLQPLPLLLVATLLATPPLFLIAGVLGETIWPTDWTPLLILALTSQVIGQGLLVYSIGVFPPLVVGLALLTQPAVSALVGYWVYGELLTPSDWIGTIAVAAALVLVRLPEQGLRRRAREAS